MKVNKLRNSLLLLLAAFIWGVAFVAQSTGGDIIGPYTFNSIRMLIGGTVLMPVIMVIDKVKPSARKPKTKQDWKILLLGGVSCGVVLFAASTLQQMGLYLGVGAGKAGFLTTCYILMVPILGLFLKKKCGWNIWVGVCITLVGLYLLCMNGSFSLQFQDGLVLACAVLFAIQILLVDYFSPLVDGVRLASLEFLTCGVIGIVPMFFGEMKPWAGGLADWAAGFTTLDAWIPLLYAAVLSSGVAYTLQIVGQEGLNPTVASLLMSFESVFSVLAGWLILKESMSSKELLGCGLIFAAVVLAQIDFGTMGEQKQGK